MAAVEPRLILIDGMAVIYRAFYAIKNLTTRDGRPSNAVFGFVKMLRQLSNTWKPTHWAVVFDGGLPAERTALLPEYKAQRVPMPDAMRGQIPLCQEYLSRAGVCRVFIDGQEADDVIATISAWAVSTGGSVLIASSDKDFFQLVNERIGMIPVSGDVSHVVGPEEVAAKTGVRPEQIVDWLALTGDAADNIPGVPGIGLKTAAKLMVQYGSLENLLKVVQYVEPTRIKDALCAHQADIQRNRSMVRLRTNLGMSLQWDPFRYVDPSLAQLGSFFDDLDFDSFRRDLEQGDLFESRKN